MRIEKAKIRLPNNIKEENSNESSQRVSTYTESYKGEYYNIEVTKLIPFKNQSRKHFDQKSLEELASTIRVHGIRQPLTILPSSEQEGKYEIISGERRWKAAQIAGLTKVPCIIIHNQEAAEEIARQLRLRDIGGIIVVDFIDMKSAEYKHKLYEVMQEAMKPDKAKHVILPISKFGLMEITRQRMKEQVVIDTRDPLLHNNKYKVDQPLQIIDNIRAELFQLKTHSHKNFLLYVHPFIYAYLKKDTFSFRMYWFAKTNKIIRLIQDSSLYLGEYKLQTKEQ